VNADDAREIEPPEEEKKFPEFGNLTKLNNWVHHNENILQVIFIINNIQGRESNSYETR